MSDARLRRIVLLAVFRRFTEYLYDLSFAPGIRGFVGYERGSVISLLHIVFHYHSFLQMKRSWDNRIVVVIFLLLLYTEIPPTINQKLSTKRD